MKKRRRRYKPKGGKGLLAPPNWLAHRPKLIKTAIATGTNAGATADTTGRATKNSQLGAIMNVDPLMNTATATMATLTNHNIGPVHPSTSHQLHPRISLTFPESRSHLEK